MIQQVTLLFAECLQIEISQQSRCVATLIKIDDHKVPGKRMVAASHPSIRGLRTLDAFACIANPKPATGRVRK